MKIWKLVLTSAVCAPVLLTTAACGDEGAALPHTLQYSIDWCHELRAGCPDAEDLQTSALFGENYEGCEGRVVTQMVNAATEAEDFEACLDAFKVFGDCQVDVLINQLECDQSNIGSLCKSESDSSTVACKPPPAAISR